MQRQRDDQLLRFSKINKGIRWNFAHHRVLPAHQDFQPGHSERLRIHDGLIDHVELVVLDGRKDLFPGIKTDSENIEIQQTCRNTADQAEEHGVEQFIGLPGLRIDVNGQRNIFQRGSASGDLRQIPRLNQHSGLGG